MTFKTLRNKKHAEVTRGGLPGTYRFAQLHFHWGSSDGQGSEHTINGKSYPLELHLVHFKTEYGNSIGESIAGFPKDGLAVLGIFFEIQEEDNHDLNLLIDAVTKSKIAAKDGYPMNSLPLADLLPRNTDKFYRYQGGLTSPGCFEVVVWTVFKDTVGISKSQLEAFRKVLQDDSTALVDNFRNVQPLHGRQVLDVDTSTKLFKLPTQSSATLKSASFVAAIVLSLSLVFVLN